MGSSKVADSAAAVAVQRRWQILRWRSVGGGGGIA